MLTKDEMKKVMEILRDASSKKVVSRSDSDSDLWVAFVSLLRGNYIVESPPDSRKYILTTKGRQYFSELGA